MDTEFHLKELVIYSSSSIIQDTLLKSNTLAGAGARAGAGVGAGVGAGAGEHSR